MTSTSDTRQFVLLDHETDPHHVDLMLERSDVLWTWSFYDLPLPDSFDGLFLERIQDHRKRYLDYEGPISEGRGTVTRIDRGSYNLTKVSGDGNRLTGEFSGRKWSFRFTFSKTGRTSRRDNTLWRLVDRSEEDIVR